MSTYPWGPHGPESGPNQVTPNPTPSYVPPPPTPSYAPPTSTPISYGGGAVQYTGPVQRGPKHYFLALVLTFVFGPLGLFYATKKGALTMLFLLVAVPVGLSLAGVLPYGSLAHPFAILDHSSVMDGFWSVSVFFSMIWSVIAVKSYNANLKAGS